MPVASIARQMTVMPARTMVLIALPLYLRTRKEVVTCSVATEWSSASATAILEIVSCSGVSVICTGTDTPNLEGSVTTITFSLDMNRESPVTMHRASVDKIDIHSVVRLRFWFITIVVSGKLTRHYTD